MPTLYPELRLVILTGAEDAADLSTAALSTYLNAIGNADGDTLTGNAFDNILNGEAGNDTLIGGLGNDTYIVDVATDVVTEAASGGTDLIRSSVSLTLVGRDNVENLTLTSDADGITGTGNALNNVIIGGAGTNTLDGADGNDNLFGAGGIDSLAGGIGNDILDGGEGVDVMVGGSGNDIYFVNVDGETVTELASEGTDTVNASVTYSIAASANVENITLTGAGALGATGNAGNNVLNGNLGANALTGGEGNDTLDGGAGADNMNGGGGNDAYVIDNTGDVITDSAGTDSVSSSLVNYTLAAGLENGSVAAGSQAFNLTGNTAANTLTGNVGANMLNGGAGADTMNGGAGNDTYLVDNSLDVVNDAVGGGIDRVETSVRYTLGANDEIEFLTATGTTSITLTGSISANTIEGNSGRNALLGLGGNDVLNGGLGRDDMRGGVGRDTFQFDTRLSSSNNDRVLDFNVRDDSIQLDNAIFRKLGGGSEGSPRKLSSAFFNIGTEADDRNDFLLYDSKSGVLSYDSNGSARGGELVIATLSKNLKLTASDFFVI